MKVIFHEDFYKVYTSDPAAEDGRIEAVMEVISNKVDLVMAQKATLDDIEAVHTSAHIERVKNMGLHEMASLSRERFREARLRQEAGDGRSRRPLRRSRASRHLTRCRRSRRAARSSPIESRRYPEGRGPRRKGCCS